MKRVARFFGLFCMVGAVALTTSCKKKETNTSINVGAPQMTEVVMEGDRAYIDEGWRFMWHGGDEIMVYNLDTDASKSRMSVFHNTNPVGVATKLATFQGEDVGDPLNREYRYFYPINMVSKDLTELRNENRQTFTVSDTQDYYLFEESDPYCMIDPLAMPMSINTNDLHEYAMLKHMFGVGRFLFKTARNQYVTVEQIELTDNFWNLTGTLSVKLHEVDTTQLWQLWNEYNGDVTAEPFATHFATYAVGRMGYLPNPTGKTITMNCTHASFDDPTQMEGIVLEAGRLSTEFNFVLRPLALSEGFTLKLTGVYGDDMTPYELNIDRYAQPNLDYAIKPGIKNTWEYPFLIDYELLSGL